MSRRPARALRPHPGVLRSGRSPAVIPVAPPYQLGRTLQSGQCFRWRVAEWGAWGVVDGTVAVVRPAAGGLAVEWEGPPGSAERLARHLGADQPLEQIEGALGRDPVLRRLLPRTSGIALMRQDPWECLISYVISAYNNIPKISLSVRRLSACFGESIGRASGGESVGPGIPGAADPAGGPEWAFPTPDRLARAGLAELRACALGYRAPYVRDLARLVAGRTVGLDAITTLGFDDARAALLELPGVGEKVADCVLLFAYGRGEAFPVDVWVQRAVERWYFGGRPLTARAIRAWARDRFGPLAGYAQQHLFAGMRPPGRRRAPAVGGAAGSLPAADRRP